MESHAEALSLDNRGHRGQLRTERAARRCQDHKMATDRAGHWWESGARLWPLADASGNTQVLCGPESTYRWWRLDVMMSVCLTGVMGLGDLRPGLYAGLPALSSGA